MAPQQTESMKGPSDSEHGVFARANEAHIKTAESALNSMLSVDCVSTLDGSALQECKSCSHATESRYIPKAGLSVM